MFFGTAVDEETSFALLDRFVERGGNFIDTANCYCFWCDGSDGGDSERLLGRWLASRGNRNEIVVATKLGALPAGPGEWPGNREGLSAAIVRHGVRGSLERLGIDRIDLLYGHVDDPSTPLEETVSAFAELVEKGLADQVGMSNQGLQRFARTRELARQAGISCFTAWQQRHTYLQPDPGADFSYQTPVDEPMLAYARTQSDLTILAFGVLLKGAYTDHRKQLPGPYSRPGTTRALSVLRDVAAEAGATPNQVVYAWLLGGSPAIVPVVGVSRAGQLDEAMDAADLELTLDQRRRLDLARCGR
jgi:aryl-alcohol dehydrogenase-like predicted oxidoreductase